MKFSISSKELHAKLICVSKVLQKKNIIRILDYAMISMTDGKFWLTGASVENQITVGLDLLPMTKDEFKPFCIEVSQFIAILATLSEQPIEIDVDESNGMQTTIRYDGGDFKLSSLPADEFPIRNRLDVENTVVAFNIPSSILIPCAKAAQTCAGDEELYPSMMSVALDVSTEGVTFVSTDRNQLYCYSYIHGVPFLTTGRPSMILLHRSLISALEAVVAKNENVVILANNKTIEVSAGDAFLLATVVNGKYPDYRRVIPKETSYHAKLSVADLTLAIRRASIMADPAVGMLTLSKEADAIVVCSNNVSYGKSAITRLSSGDCNMPDGFRIGLKSSNLLNLLGNISTQDVCLNFSANDKPVLVKEDADNSALIELIMPMNIAAD